MIYYLYNNETFEYYNFVELPDDRILKEGSTKKPNLDSDKHIVWNGEDWVYLDEKEFTEHKIKLGLIEINEFQKVNENGEIVPKTEIDLYNEGKLDLEYFRQKKIQEINLKARQLIESGFEFEGYIYDTKIEDQLNFLGYLDVNSDFDIRCTKKGEKTKRLYPHSKEQIKKVFLAFTEHKRKILNEVHEEKLKINKLKKLEEILNFESFVTDQNTI